MTLGLRDGKFRFNNYKTGFFNDVYLLLVKLYLQVRSEKPWIASMKHGQSYSCELVLHVMNFVGALTPINSTIQTITSVIFLISDSLPFKYRLQVLRTYVVHNHHNYCCNTSGLDLACHTKVVHELWSIMIYHQSSGWSNHLPCSQFISSLVCLWIASNEPLTKVSSLTAPRHFILINITSNIAPILVHAVYLPLSPYTSG